MLHRILLIAFALVGTAAAQDQGFGFDPSKRTKIDAERVERGPGGRTLIGEGGITISQPGVVLSADRMEVTVDPATNEIRRLVATGRVRYANVAGDAIAGQRAVYVADENRLTVTGEVVVLQKAQVATADRLVYDTVSGAMQMTSEPGGRVEGLFIDAEGA